MRHLALACATSLTLLTGFGAHAATPADLTCQLVPVSPQKGQFALNYRMVITASGAASIEGIPARDVRVREGDRKTRANWKTDILRIAATTDRATGQTKANAKADGYTGSLRWSGTCK